MDIILLLSIILTIFAIIIASLILYARWNYGVLERMGIPVVKPHFILGSTHEIHRKVGALEDVKRFNKMGPVFGVYEGREPQVHICDADIIRSIFIKDFEHFNGRRPFDFGSPFLNEMPGFVTNPKKWRFLRTLNSPTLTSAKIKAMSSGMKDTLQDMTDNWRHQIKEHGGDTMLLDVKQAIFSMLTDMITRSFFNIKITNPNDPNNYFAKIVKRLVEGGTDDPLPAAQLQEAKLQPEPSMIFPLSLAFPFLSWFSPPIFNPNAADEFQKTFKGILAARRLTNSGRANKNDYMDTISNWMDQLDTPEYKEAGVTEQTILCLALVNFFGGQDQISTILPYMFHEVAKNPDKIQNRILEELDAFLKRHNGEINYEDLHELVYLYACINESMRLVPFFIRAERVCQRNWEGHGLNISKGMTVIVPIWAANRNPEHFPDPEVFNPERFLPENKGKMHPCALVSFGLGPRNCTGQRLAYDMMLFAAAYIYKSFRFKINPKTAEIEFLPGSLIMARTNGIHLDIISRK